VNSWLIKLVVKRKSQGEFCQLPGGCSGIAAPRHDTINKIDRSPGEGIVSEPHSVFDEKTFYKYAPFVTGATT
jgi:hypothetical protein